MTVKNFIINYMKKSAWILLTRGSKLVLFALFLFGCNEKPVLWDIQSKDQVIAQYIDTHPEFSEFAKILESTNLGSLLSVRGPFTLFLPSDDQMNAYYAEKGVSSYLELDPVEVRRLLLNHLIPSKIETGDIGLGAVRDTNALGDYLVTEFEGSDIIINKSVRIIKRNIPAANGVIHLIDKVIEPVTVSVYDLIAANPGFSLFAEGLKRTGLKDTLQLITFPFNGKPARTRFTVLAVPDSIFAKAPYNITTIDGLISYFTDAPDSVTYLNNGFYRYMEYHCLGETYYFNNLSTRAYPILSYDNNISVTVDNEDYKLNINKLTKEYTHFIESLSNYPAKNGAVHTISDLLPVFEPEPTPLVWETTDHFDLKQGDYYDKYYMRWFDGQNTFENIKWEGDYLLYYFKDHDTGKLLNDDCLSMSGWWWVQVTTPKIMKGKYKITSNCWSGQTNYAVYIDGVNTAMIKAADPAESTSWGELNWTTTEHHTIKIVTLSPGMLFWDTVIFTPIK
jgi:uncharacterized surface protein with fasciclin (FAS1) repeats